MNQRTQKVGNKFNDDKWLFGKTALTMKMKTRLHKKMENSTVNNKLQL